MIMIVQNDASLPFHLKWHVSFSRSGNTDNSVQSLLDQDIHSYLQAHWERVILTLTLIIKE
jgi:hypothetical protein